MSRPNLLSLLVLAIHMSECPRLSHNLRSAVKFGPWALVGLRTLRESKFASATSTTGTPLSFSLFPKNPGRGSP